MCFKSMGSQSRMATEQLNHHLHWALALNQAAHGVFIWLVSLDPLNSMKSYLCLSFINGLNEVK